MRARVNGRGAYFLVDSGADTHVLTATFVRSIGVAPHEVLDDVPVAAVDVRLPGDWRIPQRDIPVLDFPPRAGIEKNGIAGMLSPQLLARDGFDAVVDVPGKRLTLAPTRERSRLHGVTFALTACTPWDALPTRHYTLHALVGGQPVVLEVDTGRATTALYFERVGKALHLSSPDEPLSAELEIPASSPNGAFIGFGSFVIATDHFAPDKRCVADGLLALDVLRNCVLALGTHDGVAVCRNDT